MNVIIVTKIEINLTLAFKERRIYKNGGCHVGLVRSLWR